MIKRLELRNFKSAQKIDLNFGALTVLTGLNGSGKSSVLHSLALIRQSIENRNRIPRLLLGGELLCLGRSEDIRFEAALEDDIGIKVVTEDGTLSIIAHATQGSDTLKVTCIPEDVSVVAKLFLEGFQYIQADRITPAIQYLVTNTSQRESGWLGCRGEFTIDYLLQNYGKKVSCKRQFPTDHKSVSPELLVQVAPTDGLLDQSSAWLQLISPGARLRIAAVDLADVTSLRFAYTGTTVDSGSREHRPTNVGFGLTYVLPIIVAALSAAPNALVLVENPEAHLHPQGQFALGQLLARCAADGIQIVVETHSDHLLNGIRVAAKNGIVSHEAVAVHFFTRDIESGASKVDSPVLFSNGRFSEWPEGFFDEWSKALDELLDI